MELKEQEYRQVRKAARNAYRYAQKALEEKKREINAQQHQLREEFKQRMKSLHDMYNQPTEHSIKSHHKREAYNIKRFLDKNIIQWKSAHLDIEHAGIGFEITEDHIQFGITIPFNIKHQTAGV